MTSLICFEQNIYSEQMPESWKMMCKKIIIFLKLPTIIINVLYLTVLSSHEHLRSILLSIFLCRPFGVVIPAKDGHKVKLFSAIQLDREFGFSGCRIKPGMARTLNCQVL
jgi:hypothetical protein